MSDEKRPGIGGLTSSFKEVMSNIPDGAKVVFAGSVAVCTPFAELLAYAVKDRSFRLIYVPSAQTNQAKSMVWRPGIGFAVTDQEEDPSDPDAIVILGGLAMPKFGCPLGDVEGMIVTLSRGRRPKLIGVCFMHIFQRMGWTEAVPFDAVIDATMEIEVRTAKDWL
jgi:hypothetical protein